MRLFIRLIPVVALLSPLAALAVTNTPLARFVANVTQYVIQPIILFLFALAMFFFVNGVIVYILKAAEPKERAKGTQHMLWGVIGLLIMSSAVLILHLLADSFASNGVTVPNGF